MLLRRGHPAFAPAARQTVLDLGPQVFAIQRESPEGRDRMLCLHNVNAGEATVSAPAGRQPIEAWGHRWMPLP